MVRPRSFLTWPNLARRPGLRPDGLTVRDVPDRVAERGDLFRGDLTARQDLPALA
jgi:hypothetical protein